MSKKSKVEHYLVSLTLTAGVDMHVYVMTDDKSVLESVWAELTDKAEELSKQHGFMFLPIILQTGPLKKKTTDEIRNFLRDMSPEAAEALRTATDFHRTVWAIDHDSPFGQKLMQVH